MADGRCYLDVGDFRHVVRVDSGHLGLRAGLRDDVLALLHVAGLHHGVVLGCALLFLGALLLRHQGAALLRHLLHRGGAVRDGAGGTLLVGNTLGHNLAVGHAGGRALLLRLGTTSRNIGVDVCLQRIFNAPS